MGITIKGWISSYDRIYFYIILHVHLYTSSHLLKKMNETRYKNILSEKVSGI